ncbi:hypothetical protein AVEN_98847-1 [Araneus ventricosus]|uniref:Uncharacterized protein n=1 Tax=Araneus ventricosus TaxID=182803 RepID=A0A4Y2SYC9_ARAVE|nr:hypothetical protein AVEN_98847-1 [Araneus ventricosus]
MKVPEVDCWARHLLHLTAVYARGLSIHILSPQRAAAERKGFPAIPFTFRTQSHPQGQEVLQLSFTPISLEFSKSVLSLSQRTEKTCSFSDRRTFVVQQVALTDSCCALCQLKNQAAVGFLFMRGDVEVPSEKCVRHP